MDPTTRLLLLWAGVASLLAFALGVADKVQARRYGRRVRERTLLLCALVGGSPGLLLAMVLAHHKTSKSRFLSKVLLVVALQLAAAFLFVGRA